MHLLDWQASSLPLSHLGNITLGKYKYIFITLSKYKKECFGFLSLPLKSLLSKRCLLPTGQVIRSRLAIRKAISSFPSPGLSSISRELIRVQCSYLFAGISHLDQEGEGGEERGIY